MSGEHDKALEDQLASWIIGHHDSLASGDRPPVTAPVLLPQELLPRAERARACLDLLERVMPRKKPGTPGDRTPNALPMALDRAEMAESIGRIRLVRELGRGGFGIVFLAEDPTLRRQVALKVPYAQTLGDPELRKRFVWEAEAAAKLSHPNIVSVLEAGEAGAVLYIASEYCPGTTLAEWLAERKEPAPPRSAASLVATLGEAVHYMHSRGILHRDLKPGNILLAAPRAEASPAVAVAGPELEGFVPKVTDFGLAKVLERVGDETRTGTAVGTLRYMAPEQVYGRVKDIGQHTDVYALGVMLYELLTGRAPFQGDSDLETREQIVSREPAPPSRITPRVGRDLDTICLKCLAKEPAKRYRSADELADDLGRFLSGDSIRARPVGRRERLWRWCRRKPAVAGLLTALVVALVSGLIGIIWQWQRAEANYRQADEYLTQARRSYLKFAALGTGDYLSIPGIHPLRLQSLEEARQFFASLYRARGDDPAVQWGLASVYEQLGLTLTESGKLDGALDAFQQAEPLFLRLSRDHPENASHRGSWAAIHLYIGALQRDTGRLDEALLSIRKAQEVQEQVVRENPKNAWYHRNVAVSHWAMARVYVRQGKLHEARRHYDQDREILDRLEKEYPEDLRYQDRLAWNETNQGLLYYLMGQPAEALRSLNGARCRWNKLLEEKPYHIWWKDGLAKTDLHLNLVHQALGQPKDAADALERARVALEVLARESSSVTAFQRDLAAAYVREGDRLRGEGRFAQARERLEQACVLCLRLLHDNPAVTESWLVLAEGCMVLARLPWTRS
jgi:tetratricopeptide (TPR) repeat protein